MPNEFLLPTRRAAWLLLAQPFIASTVLAGLGSKKAMYVGGTWTGLKEGAEGKLDTNDSTKAKFVPDGKSAKSFEIPYDKITTLEYGQKAGRRVGATIGLGVATLGLGALPVLFSKKRKHFFSIGFTAADGSNQGVVIEIGKDITRATLMTFETRSGRKIEYESEDARKNVGN
jgi:hypothetical protein